MQKKICFVCLKESQIFSSQDSHNYCESCSKMKSMMDSQSTDGSSEKNEQPLIQLGKRKREPEEEKNEKAKVQRIDEKNEKAKVQKNDVNSVCSGSYGLMLAKNYDAANPGQYKGWLMSEKLDGVRCFWNGTNLYSRNGNQFYAPDWFKKALPKNLALDGELWTKRDDFQNCVGIVKKQDMSVNNEKWKEIVYMVYDAPLLTQHNFKKRLEIMEQVIQPMNSKCVKIHK